MTRKDTLTVSFHTFLPSEIFGWAVFFDSLHPAGSPGGIFLFCRGAACRSRRYAAGPNRLSLKWKWPQICHCEGALRPWQSREGTGDSHRPPLKWYAPIASVAALSERLVHLQIMQRKFIGMRLPSLSLRGPEGAVAISGRQLRFRRWLSHDTVEYCEIAPQGHFLALRAQGATSACGLLAMTIRGRSPF